MGRCRVDVRIPLAYKVAAYMGTVISLGTTLLAYWMWDRSLPAVIDAGGVTLRSGRRLAWGDLIAIHRVRRFWSGGRRCVQAKVELVFSAPLWKKVVVIDDGWIVSNHEECLAVVSEALGKPVTMPRRND